jgi:hypothetical protein
MHSPFLGTIYNDILRIVSWENEKTLIGEVNLNLGKATDNKYLIQGQILLIELETYDIIVFSLIREMFGLDFPLVRGITYDCVDYAIVKRFGDRMLEEKDYYPNSELNLIFRYKLGLLIYFCKLVGCPLKLSDVRVYNGCPFLWKCNLLGYRNAGTLDEEEFLKVFGLEMKQAKHGTRNLIIDKIIEYFLEIDFDTDYLRGVLHLSDEMIRYRKGLRVRYELSRRPKEIEDVIEENYGLLQGPNPFAIFKRR